MKKYLLVIFLLLGAITYTLFFSEKPALPEFDDSLETSNEEIKTKAIAEQKEASVVQDNSKDDSVPWTELQDKWREELKDFLIGLDASGGEDIFESYLAAKRDFDSKIAPLLEEKARYVKKSQQNENLELADKQRYIEIDKASDQALVDFKMKIRVILGVHYPAARRLYQEQLESIQAHNSNEGRIGLDEAFESD